MSQSRWFGRRWFTPWRASVLVFTVLGIVAVSALVLAAIALSPRDSPASGEDTKSAISTKSFTTAAFIGDSATQGAGASGPETRWVTLVATAEGWEPLNLGRSGTGYLSSAEPTVCGKTKCPNYQEMARIAVVQKPDVVLVSGGQSDFDMFAKDPAAVTAAISSTYDVLRAGLPDATIYAIGPLTTGPINKATIAFDAAVRDAATKAKATYVSLLEPNVVKSSFIGPDGVHLNDAGYAALAARVEEAVKH
jgi:lysophospholipase L1-like esterase